MPSVRLEQPGDIAEIRKLNEAAFGQPDEGRIVDALRKCCGDIISLVAESNGKVIGHVMFSPVVIESPCGNAWGMALGPMAVLPEFQRQGVGTKLVESSIKVLRGRLCPFIIVLGHPKFYPRFGFEPASRRSICCQWPGVPDEAFMVKVLEETSICTVPGIAKFREEFNQAK